MTSILKASLWTYTLSNLHETLTDLGPSVGSKSVKVSWRLVNVYVHSDDFSKEVIFKNVMVFFPHPLHKSQQLHNKAMQPICRATVCFLALFMFRSSFVDNFIIPVKYVKTCSEIPPCDPSFQRVPWDAWVRRRQSVPRHVTKQGARDKVHLIKVTWLGT